MVCVGVGWVVVGCGGGTGAGAGGAGGARLVVGWLSSSFSFFFLCFATGLL